MRGSLRLCITVSLHECVRGKKLEKLGEYTKSGRKTPVSFFASGIYNGKYEHDGIVYAEYVLA